MRDGIRHLAPGRHRTPGVADERASRTTAACLACDYPDRAPLFAIGEYRYVACPRCGLAHLDPQPSQQQLQSCFDDSYFAGGVEGGYDDYVADEALHRANAEARLRLLARMGADAPGNVLDVGCAHGFFLERARAHGWAARGVDVSPAAADAARRRFGLEVLPTLEAAAHDYAGAHDVVTLFQVVEHVASPLQALREARALLHRDGMLVVETWDRDSRVARLLGPRWHEIAPPTVGWLWDRESLGLLLARAGFRVTAIRRTSKRVSLRFVASLLDDRPGLPATVARLIRRSHLEDRSLSYRFGDLITVTATRR